MSTAHTTTRGAAADLVDLARPTLLRGADAVGRITAACRVLPDLLIVGGQRCGTTSMYQALVQQPTVFRPVWRQGVHYFDVDYAHGLSWYRAHFPLRAQLRRAERRYGTRALAFESSPYYLFHPLAAARIAQDLPGVRLLVLVRDPVERAYSAHAHEYARGFETLDFTDALAAEAARLEGEDERLQSEPGYESAAHRHQAYRARGEYAAQLERVAGLVGRDRVKVVDSHRFFTDPEPVYSEVLDWLGVSSRAHVHFERHNARPRPDLPAHLREELETHFEPHDRALEAWLGHRPSWCSPVVRHG